MKLNLSRPLIFFDLETTGTNITQDRIVEISLIKLMPDGTTVERTRRINPECPIPAEATAIHHITDDDVRDCPTFKQVAKSLAEIFRGADIAGFNSNRFDIPLLDEEFQRADVDYDFTRSRFIDVQTIFHKKEPRNLSAAYRFYCDRELTDAHSANADTRATYEILMAQLEHYDDLPTDVQELSKFSSQGNNVDLAGRVVLNDQGKEIINFGKHRGKLVEDIMRTEPSYYRWIMDGDFPKNTKDVFTKIYMRVHPKR